MANGKAVIYARVSTDDGRQDAGNQLDILRDMAGRAGLEIQREYVDHATGGNSDRVEFQRLLADTKKFRPGTITLLFFSLDRLTREGALKTLEYLSSFDQAGVQYKSATEGWLDSAGPFKDVIIAMLATLAKQEKVRIGERTRAGLARVRKEGSRSGKAIGRPRVDVDVDQARILLRTLSEKRTAETMGIPLSTLRTKLHGRSEKKLEPIWSEPVFGKLTEEGVFAESEGGSVVIRYERRSQKAYCINHQVELNDCWERHQ